MIEVKIPEGEDLVNGSKCLEYEIPWMTPGSIHKLNESLNENDIVLEIGTGGSTLFFAQRCKKVIAIETQNSWASTIRAKISEKELLNIIYVVLPTEKDICDFITDLNTDDVTVISVDPEGDGFDRSKILNALLDKGISENLRMIVLDNYSHERLFTLHHDKNVMDYPNWESFSYDHERWAGSGTRIYLKK